MKPTAQAIVKQHGGDWHGSYGALPGPNHSPQDRSVTVIDGECGPVFHSFAGDDPLVVKDFYLGPPDRRRQQPLPHASGHRQNERGDKRAYAEAIWQQAHAITPGCVAASYLSARGLDEATSPSLRWSPSLKHPNGQRLPVLIAAYSMLDGRLAGVQRTFLRPDGSWKADIEPAKLSLGKMDGAAVQLAPAGGALALAEGIEDALSISALFGIPAWASLGVANLAKIEIPTGVRSLLLAPDRDNAGMTSARKAADQIRARQPYTAIRFLFPPEGFQDWNDFLLELDERAAISNSSRSNAVRLLKATEAQSVERFRSEYRSREGPSLTQGSKATLAASPPQQCGIPA